MAQTKKEISQEIETLRQVESELAGIEYVGMSGISHESMDGVLRFLQYGDQITHAKILSNSGDHCLLLTINGGDTVAVKSGFGSGYLGEGPHTFSYVLQVLELFGTEIEEYEVSEEFILRLDQSALTNADLEQIQAMRPVRPSRLYDYIIDPRKDVSEKLQEHFPLAIPFAIIDHRIVDLATSFWQGPDDRLMKGYRRLEDVVRKRTGIDEHGAKLFHQAFVPDKGLLTWPNASESERAGKMNLFAGTYTAYRNRRAHRESKERKDKLLTEFLLLNHLYGLEREAINANP
ncbi:MAG TPA: TIGR02391 family protein [Candidatus Dormibacteraeota bacterium]|jgi:uncharacterized protein (TIGR02391 family)|nr:TIGR02391 family protein [Candidatus Dormibacteraeota bacterium]